MTYATISKKIPIILMGTIDMGAAWEAYIACIKGKVNEDLLPYLRSQAVQEVGEEALAAAKANFPEITKQVKERYQWTVTRRGAFDE